MNRDLMDYLNIMSFVIGVLNLEENIDQSTFSQAQGELSEKIDNVLGEIHAHLEKQDKDLEVIKVILRGKEMK